MKISDEILSILTMCLIKEKVVYLPQIQIDRKIYLKVNKHLEHLGGKWNRKAKGHVFDDDPTDSFENMLLTGETTDFKKEFQFFETPPELARKMVEMAEIKSCDWVLEPSAGLGAIAKFITTGRLVCNDINSNLIGKIPTSDAVGSNLEAIFIRDFLNLNSFLPTPRVLTWDKIIQNPPFTKQQDIDHVLHAYSLLNADGILVSIVSEGSFFRENKKSIDFRQFLSYANVDKNPEIARLPEGTFKASGTMARARLIKIVKK